MLGVSVLGQTFLGDLTPRDEAFTRWYPGLQFTLGFDSRRVLSPTLNFSLADFVAQDRTLGPVDGRQPNRLARTQYFSTDIRLAFRLLKNRRVQPYAAAGIGFLVFNVRDETGRALLNAASTRAQGESYSNVAAYLPLAVGVQWRISQVISTAFEVAWVQSFSDYLDNVNRLGNRSGPDALFQTRLALQFTLPAPMQRSRLN